MTSQKDIQSLLDDLEGILPKAEARLPWSKPGEVAPVRRVLERVRSFLISQQQNLAASSEKPLVITTPQQQEIVQQLMQGVADEMNLLRAEVIKPLQADVEALKRERDSLKAEIGQLESKKQLLNASTQLHSLQQQVISEFSVGLINRCSDSLAQQLAQTLVNLEAHLLSSTPTPLMSTPGTSHLLPPQQRVEQLRQLQAQSDELMLTLDANQRAIFEVLERNLQSYQESLSLGLEKMHRLGLQGEMLFTAFVNTLAQQLGREASNLSPSLSPVSEPVSSTGAISTTKPETLLPTEALQATKIFSSPNPLVTGEHIPLVSPLVSPLASPEPLPQPTAEDTFPEHHVSQDWELIEGLDLETPASASNANQEIDTFIQLDIDDPDLLPALEEIDTTENVFSQEQDELLGWTNEPLITTPENQTTELSELDAVDVASEVDSLPDNRREEIEDLYESIFGQDSSLDTPTPSELDHTNPQALSSAFLTQWDEQFSRIASTNTDQIHASYQNEEALFEGLEDPAFEIIETEQPPQSTTDLPSWEDLFVEDSENATPLAGEQVENKASQQEIIKTIASLTELCEEMDLNYNFPASTNNSISATIIPELEYPISNPEPQNNLLEDRLEEHYITASPDENLLTTGESEQNPEIEILLDQNTLQQLSEDLYSFEDTNHQIVSRKQSQKPPEKYVPPANIVPEADRINTQNHWLLRSDELLAEDWEEFAFNDLYDEDFSALSPVNSTTEESQLTPEEIVQLDFDPHLFPSERLELDQENAKKLTLSEPQDLAVKAELVAPEDEAFVEMQWDEPIDNTTDEKITSSELPSSKDSVSPPTIAKNQETPNKPENEDLKG